MNWKAFNNQKKEIDTKNAKNGSFLEVSERKFSSVPFRFQGKSNKKHETWEKAVGKKSAKISAQCCFLKKTSPMTIFQLFCKFPVFPKLYKNQTWNTKGKDENFFSKTHFEKKAEAGSYVVGNRETSLINFLIFFLFFPKQPNASKCLNVKHLETEFVFVLVHKGLQKIGAIDKFRLST